MLLDAIAVEGVQRRRGPVHAAERLDVLDVEQQPPVSRAPHLVETHEPLIDVRLLALRRLLERGRPFAGLGETRFDRLQLALDRVQLLGLDLPVDFEAAEIVEDRLLLLREIVRFAAERGEAVGDAPGERIVLSSRRDGERDRRDEARERDRPSEH